MVQRHTTDEDRRCSQKFWTLYIFYWIKVFLKLLFAVSFSELFITIQYAVFCKSISTFYISLYIYIYICTCSDPHLEGHIHRQNAITRQQLFDQLKPCSHHMQFTIGKNNRTQQPTYMPVDNMYRSYGTSPPYSLPIPTTAPLH